MDELQELIEESNLDRARIQQETKIRDEKDKKIIRMYCALNNSADVYSTINLLEKYQGMYGEDKKTVKEFKEKYPDNLNLELLQRFMDVEDIYSRVLGGGNDDE